MNDYIVRKVEIYSRARQALARVQRHYDRRSQESGWRPYYNSAELYGNRGTSSMSGQQQSWATSQLGSEDPQWEDAQESMVDQEEQDMREGEAGSTQWERNWWSNWNGSNWGHQTRWHISDNADWVDRSDELLPDFLQGWYLLSDANLDATERNLIQTAINGDFSLDRVAQELRSQFPEHDLQRRDNAQKHSSFWNEDHEDGEPSEEPETINWSTLSQDGMTDEGLALMTEAEVAAEEAMSVLQQARRTLKDARAKQHQVRLSRQYYKVGSDKVKMSSSSASTGSGIKCFKCGGPHKIAHCPDRQAPGKPEAHVAAEEAAPFVCFSQEEGPSALATTSGDLTTAEATRKGFAVIDGGATKTLASVTALEALVDQNLAKHQDGRVLSVDTNNQPTFGFGNSTKDRCLSTTRMGITAKNKNGELTVHTLDRGDGPILVSIATLRALKAIIDFENDMVVFRALDDRRAVPLSRSTAGHQLMSLSDDLYKDSLSCTEPVRSLKDLCQPADL